MSTTSANVTIEATVASQNRAAAASVEVLEGAATTYHLTGVTKDDDGSVLGSCECFLLRDNGDNTLTFLAYQVSNASTGVYDFTGLTSDSANLIVYAVKDNTPHVFDCTDHVLAPVEE